MISCPVCFGEFKNKDSLRVHHYKKHRKSEEDTSDQDTSYDSDQSSISSVITNKKRKLCKVNETDKALPFSLLDAYNIKHNFFAILAGKEKWGTQEQIPVDDEKLLIDAVMGTESLSDVHSLLNENIPICKKICNRIKSIKEK